MRILIKNRHQIEEMSKVGFDKHTALISIADVGVGFAKLQKYPEFLLQVAFDDVDNDVFVDELDRKPTDEERITLEKKYKMLSDE